MILDDKINSEEFWKIIDAFEQAIMKDMQNLDQDFQKIINDNFWDLINQGDNE